MHLRLHYQSWLRSHFSFTRLTPVVVTALCMVLLFIGFTQYQRSKSQATKGAAPVAYWRLDEGVGTTIFDSSSSNNGNIGNSTSTPLWKTKDDCISGSCLWFDGTNDKVGITSVGSIATNTVTVGFWIRSGSEPSNGSGWNIVISKGNGTTGWYISRNGTSADMAMRVDTSGGNNQYGKGVISTIFDNKWHYISYVINHTNSQIKAYKDGVLVITDSYTPGTGVSSTSPVEIGYNSAGLSFTKGFIDDIKLYNYERTADQIKQDYAGTGSVYGESVHIGSDNHMGSLSNGLVGYWKMDESSWNGTANEVKDASGNNNNGTAASSPGSVAGKFGYAGSFSAGSHIGNIIGDNNSLDITDQFTISAWIKPSSLSGYPAVISKWAIGAKQYKLAASLNGDGKPYLDVTTDDNTDIYLQSSQAITTTKYYHLVGVYKGGTNPFMKLYINGVDVSGTMTGGTVPSAISSNAQVVRIGTDGNNPFSGIIDDARIYNRALDPSEVKALYSWAPGPVAYYPIDEGVGNTVIYDRSGNGYNLFMDDPMTQSQWVQGKYGNTIHFRGDGTADQLYSDTWINNLPKTDMSLGFWMYWEDNGVDLADVPIGKRGVSNIAWYLTLNEVNQTIEMDTNFDGTDGFYRSSFGVVPYNQWVYMYITWDATLKRPHFYINGTETGYTATTAATGNYVDDSANTFRIADDNETYQVFPGMIDDVRIYNYLRSSSQIVEDMNGGHPFGGSPVGSQALYLKFDEGVGGTAYDWSPNHLNGQLGLGISSPTWTNDGKFGKALSFDGTNDFVNIGNNIDLSGTQPFSLSSWVKLRSVPAVDGKIISKFNDGVAGEWYLSVNSNSTVGFERECGGYGTSSSSTLATNKWYHLAGVFDGSQLKIYINGKLDKSVTDACSILATSTNIFVGAEDQSVSSQRNFPGIIDEAKIYAGALSDSQVLNEFNMGKSMTLGSLSTLADGTTPSNSYERKYCVPGDTTNCSSPLLELNFDENIGATAFDSSSNGGKASFISSPKWTQGKTGTALSFNGASDYLQIDNTALYDMGTSTPFTLSGWFKSTGSGSIQNILMGVNNTSNYYRVQLNTGFLRVQLVDTGGSNFCTIRNTTVVDDGNWHHFVGLYNRNASCTANDIVIYVDGQKQSTVVVTSTLNTNVNLDESGIRIGGSSSFFAGLIDSIRFYNYILTPAQIAWDYSRGKPTVWYKMDDCTGTTIYDSSGNGYNGTLTLGASPTAGTNCTTPGTAWYNSAPGKVNTYLNFDGTNDYININTIATPLARGSHSISLWFNLNTTHTSASTQKYLFSIASSTSDNDSIVYLQGNGELSPGSLTHSLYTGAAFADTATTQTTWTSGTWYHVVAVYDSSVGMKLYVNGILVDTDPNTARGTSSLSAQADIGREQGNQYFFGGKIDDVRVFNYPVTANQVKEIYNNGAVRFQ